MSKSLGTLVFRAAREPAATPRLVTNSWRRQQAATHTACRRPPGSLLLPRSAHHLHSAGGQAQLLTSGHGLPQCHPSYWASRSASLLVSLQCTSPGPELPGPNLSTSAPDHCGSCPCGPGPPRDHSGGPPPRGPGTNDAHTPSPTASRTSQGIF
ncbi:hypothetical protein NDU88_006065 [Pleurodeles waltl]|uniref:Uncharacterized protein n=1 Tax=Pleurodeles waltl TaxID=8319 RepID=A0AAV7N1Z4_PLEWA|nr:hypothetical protein NDU88_006065 [Pleurodeles waltl]